MLLENKTSGHGYKVCQFGISDD